MIKILFFLLFFVGIKPLNALQDTGVGIVEMMFKQIFKQFSQVSRNRFTEGVGMGLAISNGFFERLGGQIGLTSQPGKGSRFFYS